MLLALEALTRAFVLFATIAGAVQAGQGKGACNSTCILREHSTTCSEQVWHVQQQDVKIGEDTTLVNEAACLRAHRLVLSACASCFACAEAEVCPVGLRKMSLMPNPSPVTTSEVGSNWTLLGSWLPVTLLPTGALLMIAALLPCCCAGPGARVWSWPSGGGAASPSAAGQGVSGAAALLGGPPGSATSAQAPPRRVEVQGGLELDRLDSFG